MYNRFEFMVGLVDAMMDENPAEHPTIENVISRFSYIRDSLSQFKPRSLITSNKDPSLVTACWYACQVIRTLSILLPSSKSFGLFGGRPGGAASLQVAWCTHMS